MVLIVANLVSFIGAVLWDLMLGCVTYFASPHIRRRLNKSNLDYLMKLTNRKTNLILPVRKGHLDDTESTALDWTYVTIDEALVINEIQKILEGLYGPSFTFQRNMLNPDNIDTTDNMICIGGPMSTPETAKYFRTFLKKVKFRWSNKEDKIRIQKFSDFIYVTDKDEKKGLYDNEIMIGNKMIFRYDQYHEGYVFIARFIGERAIGNNDFNNAQHGTVHILFGRNADCTLAAVKMFTEHRKTFIKIVKAHKRTDHYVFIIKCLKSPTGVEVDYNQVYDITDICLEGDKNECKSN